MGRHYYPLNFLHVAGGDEYIEKVLGYGPIAYWPLNELSGTVARCWVNPAQDGTYNSAVQGWPPGTGIGDGNTAPYFDGATRYVNVFTATLQAAINGNTGTIMLWIRQDQTSFNDGTGRRALTVWDVTDYQETLQMFHTGANYDLQYTYMAGGVTESLTNFAGTSNFDCYVMTWNKPADIVRFYYRGTQLGTSGTLGVWAGTIDLAIIGAGSAVPALPFKGHLAHCALFNSELPVSAITALSTVP